MSIKDLEILKPTEPSSAPSADTKDDEADYQDFGISVDSIVVGILQFCWKYLRTLGLLILRPHRAAGTLVIKPTLREKSKNYLTSISFLAISLFLFCFTMAFIFQGHRITFSLSTFLSDFANYAQSEINQDISPLSVALSILPAMACTILISIAAAKLLRLKPPTDTRKFRNVMAYAVGSQLMLFLLYLLYSVIMEILFHSFELTRPIWFNGWVISQSCIFFWSLAGPLWVAGRGVTEINPAENFLRIFGQALIALFSCTLSTGSVVLVIWLQYYYIPTNVVHPPPILSVTATHQFQITSTGDVRLTVVAVNTSNKLAVVDFPVLELHTKEQTLIDIDMDADETELPLIVPPNESKQIELHGHTAELPDKDEQYQLSLLWSGPRHKEKVILESYLNDYVGITQTAPTTEKSPLPH